MHMERTHLPPTDSVLDGLMSRAVAALLPEGHSGRPHALALLREVERRVPGSVSQVAAGLELARVTSCRPHPSN